MLLAVHVSHGRARGLRAVVEGILEVVGIVELAGTTVSKAGSVLCSVELRVSGCNERVSVTVGERFGEAETCDSSSDWRRCALRDR